MSALRLAPKGKAIVPAEPEEENRTMVRTLEGLHVFYNLTD